MDNCKVLKEFGYNITYNPEKDERRPGYAKYVQKVKEEREKKRKNTPALQGLLDKEKERGTKTKPLASLNQKVFDIVGGTARKANAVAGGGLLRFVNKVNTSNNNPFGHNPFGPIAD